MATLPSKEGPRKKQTDPDIARLAKLIFAESHIGTPEEEAQIAQAIKVRAADIREYLAARSKKTKGEFNWEEFWQMHAKIPAEIRPYIDGSKKLTKSPPVGKKARENWEQMYEKVARAQQEIAARSLIERMQTQGVPPELWAYAINPSVIPSTEAGDAVRIELSKLTQTSNIYQFPIAPNYIAPYFQDRSRPEDLPPMEPQFEHVVNERGATVNYGLLKFVHEVERAADPEKGSIANPQTRAFALLFAKSILVKALRENPSERDSRQYENALWALVSARILKIEVPAEDTARSSESIKFAFDSQSIALLARHVETYLAQRKEAELEKAAARADSAEARDELAAYRASEEYRSGQNFISSQAKKNGVPVEKFRTIIESAGNRLYVTESQLPTTAEGIDKRIGELSDDDTGSEEFVDNWDSQVRNALQILRQSKAPTARVHLEGLEKLTQHIAVAHGNFMQAKNNFEAVRAYVNDQYSEEPEQGWASVREDGMLLQTMKILRRARAHLDSKVDRMRGWRDRELNNSEGWKPVATLLDQMLEDAVSVQDEGRTSWEEGIKLLQVAGVPAEQFIEIAPDSVHIRLEETADPLAQLLQLVETIETEMGMSIEALGAQEDLEPTVKEALTKTQNAILSDNGAEAAAAVAALKTALEM